MSIERDDPGAFRLIDSSVSGDKASYVVEVAAEGAFFEGHFPDRPVLPAVAQLVLVERLLQERHGPSGCLTAVEKLRFVKPVAPGETLTVELDQAPAAGRTRFDITGVHGTVSRGIVRWTGDAIP